MLEYNLGARVHMVEGGDHRQQSVGNALAALANGKSNWLIAVNGADTYVSPHWYASPDQVPTWLYQAVHLSGSVRVMSGQELALHLDALSAKFEGWLAPKPSWSTGEMAAAYFIEHFPRGFFPVLNHGDLAIALCFIFFYIAFAGGGPWSLDAVRNGKR